MTYFKILDISKLENDKVYEFRCMYPLKGEHLESEWIKIKNTALWRSSFNEKYYPFKYREI